VSIKKRIAINYIIVYSIIINDDANIALTLNLWAVKGPDEDEQLETGVGIPEARMLNLPVQRRKKADHQDLARISEKAPD
jgi:hypothetical protein